MGSHLVKCDPSSVHLQFIGLEGPIGSISLMLRSEEKETERFGPSVRLWLAMWCCES